MARFKNVIIIDFGASVKLFLKNNKNSLYYIMDYSIIYPACIPISIGCFVFLLQQTDFVYEYLSLFFNLTGLKKIGILLKFETYENSGGFENYLMFLGSVYGIKNNIIGFISRLLTCFICLNCFISLLVVIILTKNAWLILPCFFISIVIYYILFSIKGSVFK